MEGGINQLAATVPCVNVDSGCITMARRHTVVQAFQFDPESDPDGEAPDEEVATQWHKYIYKLSAIDNNQCHYIRQTSGIITSNFLDRCHCGKCATMPSEAENICCLEIPQVAFSPLNCKLLCLFI